MPNSFLYNFFGVFVKSTIALCSGGAAFDPRTQEAETGGFL